MMLWRTQREMETPLGFWLPVFAPVNWGYPGCSESAWRGWWPCYRCDRDLTRVFPCDADVMYPLVLPPVYHRIDKQISRFRRWLPRKPMRLDKETLPDLEENDCYTAPFSQQRIHQ